MLTSFFSWLLLLVLSSHSCFSASLKPFRKGRSFPALIKGGPLCIAMILDLGGCGDADDGGEMYVDDAEEPLPPLNYPPNIVFEFPAPAFPPPLYPPSKEVIIELPTIPPPPVEVVTLSPSLQLPYFPPLYIPLPPPHPSQVNFSPSKKYSGPIFHLPPKKQEPELVYNPPKKFSGPLLYSTPNKENMAVNKVKHQPVSLSPPISDVGPKKWPVYTKK